MGQVDDVRRAMSPDLKAAGNLLAVVGRSLADLDGMAGSQLELAGGVRGGSVPTVDAAACRAACRAIAAAHGEGLVASCHDCSDGGLATAVAEMAIAGACGARIDLRKVPSSGASAIHDRALAFGETPGRFVCEVRPEHAAAFEARLAAVPWGWIGEVTAEPVLEIVGTGGGGDRVTVDRLAHAWRRETA
jgi:phosphoribosylformylglycinamidine synthase